MRFTRISLVFYSRRYFCTGIITEFRCISRIAGARQNRQVAYITGRAPREHYIGSYYFLTALNKGFIKPNWRFPRSTFISYVCVRVYGLNDFFIVTVFTRCHAHAIETRVCISGPYLIIDIWLNIDFRRAIWV